MQRAKKVSPLGTSGASAMREHQPDPITTLIETRKRLVLEKAIWALQNCELREISRVAHEMGGAIALYSYISEGDALTQFSRWLESNAGTPREQIESRRSELLVLLQEKRDEDGQ